jgi:hypothetical protein
MRASWPAASVRRPRGSTLVRSPADGALYFGTDQIARGVRDGDAANAQCREHGVYACLDSGFGFPSSQLFSMAMMNFCSSGSWLES